MSLKNIAGNIFALFKREPINTKDELLTELQTMAAMETLLDATVAEKDAEAQSVAVKYDSTIERLKAQIKDATARVHAAAKRQRAAWFGGKPAMILAGHELRFAHTAPAVDFEDGTEEEDVIEALLTMEGEGSELLRRQLLRPAFELDKNAIKAAWKMSENDPALREKLTGIGLCVKRKENFKVRTARVEADADTTVAGGKEAA